MTRTVTFNSPGTFIAEQSTRKITGETIKEIIEKAMAAAANIVEHHGAIPFSFTISKDEHTYYLPHCKKILLKDIPRTQENRILISNCECNKWDAVIETTKGWKYTLPFEKDCVILGQDQAEYDVPQSIMELI